MELRFRIGLISTALLLATGCSPEAGSLYVNTASIYFKDLFNSLKSTKLESNIAKVVGLQTPQSFSISGEGGALPWEIGQIKNPNSNWFSVAPEETTPYAMSFNADGTKMFVIGNTDNIYQYNLSLGFDIATAVYDGVSFSVTTEDTVPTGVLFNADGTKMFVIGFSNQNIYQYNLATGFDLSTATHNVLDIVDISGQSAAPYSLSFNADGTKMFLLDYTNRNVFEYALGTGYEINTAVYSGLSVSVAAQDTQPVSANFNPDGTKMFVTGDNTNSIYEYSLSIGFDLSSVIANTDSFSIASQSGRPICLEFNTDGTKMYILDYLQQKIYRYSLNTGFDLTTAGYQNIFSTAGQDDEPYALGFNGDGTKMYVSGSATDSIHQYSLSTAYDPTTAIYDSKAAFIGGEDIIPISLSFNPDGSKMFVLGSDTDTVFEYDLATAFDVSTATHNVLDFFPVGGQDTTAYSITFNPAGTKMFMAGQASDNVHEYDLGTAFEVTTASYSFSFSVFAQDNLIRSVNFNTDGTKMFVLGVQGDQVIEYVLGTGFDLTTASFNNVNFIVANEATNAVEIRFNPEGTKMFLVGYNTSSVFQYNLRTGFDLRTASYDLPSLSVSSEDGTPISIRFNADGSKLYMLGINSDTVYEYSLSTAYDPTTASYSGVNFYVGSEDGIPYSVYFSPDGTRMYVVGSFTDRVYQYALATAFDISTATHNVLDRFYVGGQDTSPRSISLNADGTKMHILGASSRRLYQYTLGTAYDVSSAVYDTVDFSIAAEITNPTQIVFNTSGTQLFVMGYNTQSIYQYDLGTGYDLATAGYSGVSYNVSAQDPQPYAFIFNAAGTKLFYLGNLTDSIFQYDLGSGGYPEYRVCADSVCSSVLYDWGLSKSSLISNGNYLQLRLSSSPKTSTEHKAVLQFDNNQVVDWSVTTSSF